MKKIFLCSLIIGAVLSIQAQSSIKVGINRAQLNVEDDDFYTISAKTNYLIGWHYLFNFQDIVGLETGIQFQRFSTDFKGGPGNFDFDRDYIAVPVLLKFNPGTVFSAGAGLQPSFKVQDSFSENFKTRAFDISAQVQATVNIFKSIGVEFGYNFGFIPLVEFDEKKVDEVSFSNGSARNQYFYGALVVSF